MQLVPSGETRILCISSRTKLLFKPPLLPSQLFVQVKFWALAELLKNAAAKINAHFTAIELSWNTDCAEALNDRAQTGMDVPHFAGVLDIVLSCYFWFIKSVKKLVAPLELRWRTCRL